MPLMISGNLVKLRIQGMSSPTKVHMTSPAGTYQLTYSTRPGLGIH
jgi:hypothetical protein